MTAQSATPTFEATSRTITGKHVKNLRKQGLIPAVIYGHNQASTAISLDQHSFEKLFHEVGSSTLINLTVDGKSTGKVLVHDVQSHVTRHHLTHVDFYLVNLKEKLTTELNLTFTGVADAVDILGGIFLTVRDAVEVECLPDDLVPEIEVDISKLKTFEDQLTVADITVPKGITILTDADQLLASVSAPRSEEEMAELDAPVDEVVTTEFETKDGVVEGEAAAATEEKK